MKAIVGMLACVVATTAVADEGMWTLDNFPSATVSEKYGVDIDAAWLEAAQLATTRIEGGCTGSFVSPNGLMLTNNHCVWGCVGEHSDAERNLSNDGFLANTYDKELQCKREQLSVLLETEDVTTKVGAATAGLSESEANDARKRTLIKLESACEAASGGALACESVSLYQGGQYFLYKYKRYDDVRLVFAPELDIAAFGGDPDNFNFPRYSLDMSFLRAYEDGKPAATPHHLSWRTDGVAAGEPVFITGHPGTTERSLTMSELRHLEELQIPIWLLRYSELRGRMLQWQNTSAEAERIVQQRILRIENGIKVRRNQLFALMNDEMMARKTEEEASLRAEVEADPVLRAAYGDAWENVDAAMAAYRSMYLEYLFIEQGAAFYGELFGYARALVRAAAESERPNEERLRGYTETALPALRQRLLAPRAVHAEFEELGLSFSLEKMREWLGPDHPMVKKVLGADSPAGLAKRWAHDSRLGDASYRGRLWDGGTDAIEASDDPLIQLARSIDGDARAIRRRYQNEVEAPRAEGREKIAAARFRILGTDTYPDATFTLRVTYGAVEGWQDNGADIEPFTRTAGLFDRATGQRPFKLPRSWMRAEGALDPATRFNFVATTDITGGNSGSPVLDGRGKLVGIAFDGNIHSIAGAFWFNPAHNRTVVVDSAVMLEALEKVYRATSLLEELGLAP
jgi:hypothetical protein